MQGEQEEYVREGIQWSYVDFVDNQDCLDLLEGSPSAPALGVFPLIDEANRIARATSEVRGTDHSMIVQIHACHLGCEHGARHPGGEREQWVGVQLHACHVGCERRAGHLGGKRNGKRLAVQSRGCLGMAASRVPHPRQEG